MVEPYAPKRVEQEPEFNLPIQLGKFDSSFEFYEEKNNIEKITLEQSKNSTWYTFKQERISASNFKKVCHTSLEIPSISLFKSICYFGKVSFTTSNSLWIETRKDSLILTFRDINENPTSDSL